jgi:hypothetical protein
MEQATVGRPRESRPSHANTVTMCAPVTASRFARECFPQRVELLGSRCQCLDRDRPSLRTLFQGEVVLERLAVRAREYEACHVHRDCALVDATVSYGIRVGLTKRARGSSELSESVWAMDSRKENMRQHERDVEARIPRVRNLVVENPESAVADEDVFWREVPMDETNVCIQ